MESSPQSTRGGVLVLLGVVWLGLVAVAVRFDAAFDLPRGGRTLAFVALLAPLAGLWRLRPGTPRWPSRAVGASALLACGLLALSLAFVPASAARVRRVLAPWSQSPAVPTAFRIVAATGDVTVARGESVTLAAYLDRTAADGDLPRDAELTLTPAAGPPTVVPLVADDAAAFTHTIGRVEEGFRYRVRVGPLESPTYTVRVVEPTEVLPGTTLTLHPPAYAKITLPPQRLDGPPTAARALQFSRATLDLRLNRRAETVAATWHPDGGTAVELPVPFAAAGPTARLDWVVAGSGRLTLRLDAAGPPLWEIAVAADADRPPVCDRLPGWPAGRREARPDDRLPIDARFRDDAGIDSVVLEFTRTGDATVQTLPLKLPGLGTRLVEGSVLVPLPPGTAVGDVLRARVVATDNRRDARLGLTPQRTTVPADGWTEFAVTATARPLWEQEIAARNDHLLAKLARADRHLADALAELDAVRNAPGAGLALDQRLRLAHAGDALRDLEALAGELGPTGEYAALRPAVAAAGASAAAARATLTELLGRTELSTAMVREALDRVHGQLTATRAGLAPLPAAVADATHRRLAAHQLRALATEARTLDPARPVAELRPRLDAIGSQLSGLASTSEPLRRATAAHARDEVRAFAARVRAVTQDWRTLDAAARETADVLRRDRLRAVSDRLARLGTAVEAERDRVAAAARVHALPGLPEGTLAAAHADLAAGRSLDALTELETAAGELEKVAARFDETRLARREPRDAVRQLARIQDDLARQSADARDQGDGRTRRASAQRTLIDLATAVGAPEAVRDALEAVAATLHRPAQDPRPAYDRARAALSAWADRTPLLAERLRLSRAGTEGLRREFEALARGPADGPTAAKIAALSTRVAALDAAEDPAIRLRLTRLGRALGWVEADARAGAAGDAIAGWATARREWDALADELQGRTPPDELAARLALRQRLLNDPATRPAAPADAQRELTRHLGELPTLGASGLAAAALDRSRDLEAAWRQPTPPPAEASNEALAAVRALAARLGGGETDAARVERVRRTWAEPTGFKKLSPAEANADTARRVQRLLEELDATRVGPAQPLKLKAVDALQRLRTAAEPDRQAALRQAATDALAQLAAAMNAAADAGRTLAVAGPEPLGERDARVALAAGGLWPETRQVVALRALAREVRTLSKDASEAVTQSARWPKPLPADDYARLADALEAAAPGHPAVGFLRDGAGLRALATAGLPPPVVADLQALSVNSAASLTRQTRRLGEVHARLGVLAERLPALAARQAETVRLDPLAPTQRLTAVLAAAQATGRAALDHATAGRADATAAARRDALASLRQANFWADRLGDPRETPDATAVAVGRAVAAAEQALDAARSTPTAGRLSELAAALDAVAGTLVKAGN
jgi:hypothetical protein